MYFGISRITLQVNKKAPNPKIRTLTTFNLIKLTLKIKCFVYTQMAREIIHPVEFSDSKRKGKREKN